MAFPRPDDLPSPGFRVPNALTAAGDEDDGYFHLGGTVGREAANARPDVLRAQTALAEAGYFDTRATEGPTGWYGKPLELAIRRYQKDRGLTVDGYMAPDGETITALRNDAGPALAQRPVPDLKTVDEHHERRARGEPGLLDARGGVESTGSEATQLASAAMIASDAAPDTTPPVPARSRPAPGGWRGQLLYKAGRLLGDFPEDARQAFHDKFTREALADGIASVFGEPLERRESANTKKSADIMMKKCEEVLKLHIRPLGFDFQHTAGGSVEGNGKEEVPEKAIKNGIIGRGGGGHNFPDLLYIDETNRLVVGFNIATEKGPGKYITREVSSFTSLARNMAGWVAKITGKKRKDESDEEYGHRVYDTCLEGFGEAIRDKLAKAEAAKEQPQPGPGDTPVSP